MTWPDFPVPKHTCEPTVALPGCPGCWLEDVTFGALLPGWLSGAVSLPGGRLDALALNAISLDAHGLTHLAWWTACVLSKELDTRMTIEHERWGKALDSPRWPMLLDSAEMILAAVHAGDDAAAEEAIVALSDRARSAPERLWLHAVFSAIGGEALTTRCTREQRAAYIMLLTGDKELTTTNQARHVAVTGPASTLVAARIAGAFAVGDSMTAHGLLTKVGMRGDLDVILYLLAHGVARQTRPGGEIGLVICDNDGTMHPVADHRHVVNPAEVADLRQRGAVIAAKLVEGLASLPEGGDENAVFGEFAKSCGDESVLAFGAVFTLAAIYSEIVRSALDGEPVPG